jgi:hypothetical protein
MPYARLRCGNSVTAAQPPATYGLDPAQANCQYSNRSTYMNSRSALFRGWRRRAAALSAALASAALLAACSGGPAHTAGQTGSHSALAYAQCMRSHGLPNFPDPNAQGGFSLPSGITPNSPQYLTADKACQSKEGGGHLSPAKFAQLETRLLKFAQCMRTHGVPGYPDPTFSANGGVSQAVGKSDGVNPQSPQYQAAQKTCMQDENGGSNSAPGSGGGS